MNTVLDEIKTIPGIIGGFVFGVTHGIQMNNLPPVFKEDNLNKIGKVIDKIYRSSKAGSPDITELSLYYEESTIIVRPLGKTSYLIIMSEPSLNQNLITMSMSMVADEIIQMGETFDRAAENRDSNTQAQPVKKEISIEEIINNSPISEQLSGMQAALLKIVGPMAKIIFKDAIKAWIGSNDPSESSLPRLVEILLNEINNSEREEKYINLIAPYVGDNGTDV
ncbi:MAG: hypothetical protein KKG99_12395 [Bacteroidetes bacterium]|nr:hypothetical protein [Bacteroidota bacterium]